MNKIRVIGIISSIIAIILFSFGGVSDIDSIGIAINCMLIGINITTWEECDAIIDHRNDNIHSSTQCFEKDVLLTLLKHQ